MPSTLKQLDELAERFLSGGIDFEGFSAHFSKIFISDIPENSLTPELLLWYGEIHERLEWTATRLTSADKDAGWSSPAELKLWLRDHQMRKPAILNGLTRDRPTETLDERSRFQA